MKKKLRINFKLPKYLSEKNYTKIFLILIIVYFMLTYTIVNRETITQQIDIIVEGGSFFAKTATYKVLHLNNTQLGMDKQTYEIELLTFKQINQIRNQAHLNSLIWDPLLAQNARLHSLDMAKNNYLNHTNLKGLGPTQRAQNLNIKTNLETNDTILIGIGENIGFMPQGIVKDVGVLITTNDITSAMILEWMLSEGHKKNILRDDYTFTGVGVVYDGKNNYYLTQNFQ